MNGYERRTRKKRQAILDAAQALFLQRGFTDVSVSEIAAAARVSQVTIYNYFQSKEKLLCEVLSAYMTKALAEFEALLALDIPFAEKLTRLFTESEKTAGDFSQHFMNSVPWEDPALQEAYQKIGQTHALPLFLRLIEQGRQEGAVDRDIPVEAIFAYISTFRSILTHPDFLKTGKEYKEGIQKLFFFGLIGK